MRRLSAALSALLIFVCAPPALAAGLHHELTVRLKPEQGLIEVRDKVALPPGIDAVFSLPANAELRHLAVDGRTVDADPADRRWSVDTEETRPRRLEIAYVLRAGKDRRALIDAEGTFLPGGWTPWFDAGAFTYRVTASAPPDQRVMAAGKLVEERADGDGYRVVFDSEYPDDHIPLFAGPYRVREREHNGIRLRTYFHPGLEDLADGYLDQTAGYLDLYDGWIGRYPFSAFHIVSGPLPVGLGFRNMTYIGTRVLRLPFIRFTSLGHEVLHNWWGNGVGVDYARGNWSEGLTTYMADYTYALQRDPARARDKRLDWLRDYAALPAERDRPVRAFVSKKHDAAQVIGYNKVAFIFHMLRQRLGEDVFDAGIRRFWAANKFRRAGWRDLRAAFEQASGSYLSAFFAQWLDRAGAPVLRLAEARQEADNRVRLTLEQAGDIYALRVPVRLETETGSETKVVDLTARRQSISLSAKSTVHAVSVDPDFDLFRRLAAGEAPPILRDVTLDAATRTLVLADGDAAPVARRLVARLLDTEPSEAAPSADGLPEGPVLIVGLQSRVAAFRRDAGLPPAPPEVAGKGTARVWVERIAGRPVLTVAAESADALRALLRPLPHYGRRSYLAFDGRKATVRGAWPVAATPLSARFD